MDDLLNDHAERVENSHAAHLAGMEKIRASADGAMRDLIADFGQRMLDITKQADAARADLISGFDAIKARIADEACGTFADSLGELASSANLMQQGIAERSAFMVTGELPVRDPLPKVIAPEQPKVPLALEAPLGGKTPAMLDAEQSAANDDKAA